ncbi:hypothetical protein AYO20_09009 [Fonsecaea nubica]|uniref:Carboxylic ester hydrolase n=1 Tax=Fonsecaea nubica TaxID=856822 RepID=A0A178CKJ5_9EURO|nr:hypothetical protein AYO20_09009 [Fonsecaea nubica]OAL29816.1 hypothetical protein AYO20_09009 [Fonsecaea nubica]
MRLWGRGLATTLSVAVSVSITVAPGHAAPTAGAPVMACEAIPKPDVPGATVVSITGVRNTSYSVPATARSPGISGLAICDVVVTLSHPGANDLVTVEVFLPLAGWNGRFQGVGGGGYDTDNGQASLAPAASSGYAAGITDGGHPITDVEPVWALNADGTTNWPLVVDFASRSLHDMTVVGKAVTTSFYGTPPHHSYWNGCSTGGRQGMIEAQRYPGDYNGVLAAAPAINWPTLLVAGGWPQVVYHDAGLFPSLCELDAFTNASIAECDGLDGLVDGIIGNPATCPFEPAQLVGSQLDCSSYGGGEEVTVTSQVAGVVSRIWAGPTTPSGARLWYGLNKGAPLSTLANTTTLPNGTSVGVPDFFSSTWAAYFLKRDPTFDYSTVDYSQFLDFYIQSNDEYEWAIGTRNPDLAPFRDLGGKMITWHGLADPLIMTNNTIDYRERVNALFGSSNAAVDEFWRLFLAPGVNHCGGGLGAVPTDPLAALVTWVEQGVAPETLPASSPRANGTTAEHHLCLYPLTSKYTGGDPAVATSYSCVPL